jgi:hypothetical protein
MGLKMAYILSMSEQVKLKAFLAAVLDDYKLGAISQQQAVGGITSLVDALEISDSGKSAKCYRKDVNSSGRDKEPTGARNLSL